METNNTEKIKVSDLFIDIYKHFNVISQTEKMKTLDRRELILLLTLAIDSYSEDNATVIENFRPYKQELDLIYDLQNDDGVTDADLLFLSEQTGEKYIDTTQILNLSGDELPKPLTDDEARILRRELGISQIVDEN
jgi:hypothetical protein